MNRSVSDFGIPEDMVEFSHTRIFTEETMPDKLRKNHCLNKGIWGLLNVKSGMLKYTVEEKSSEIAVKQGESVVIPPETLHFVTPCGHVSFDVTFFKKKNK